MKLKYLLDVIEESQKSGASEIMMRLNCGLPFGVRYHGHKLDCTELLCIIKDLMNDNENGNVCIRFDKDEDDGVRDIALEVCDESHRYGICICDVHSDSGGILIDVREISGE